MDVEKTILELEDKLADLRLELDATRHILSAFMEFYTQREPAERSTLVFEMIMEEADARCELGGSRQQFRKFVAFEDGKPSGWITRPSVSAPLR